MCIKSNEEFIGDISEEHAFYQIVQNNDQARGKEWNSGEIEIFAKKSGMIVEGKRI